MEPLPWTILFTLLHKIASSDVPLPGAVERGVTDTELLNPPIVLDTSWYVHVPRGFDHVEQQSTEASDEKTFGLYKKKFLQPAGLLVVVVGCGSSSRRGRAEKHRSPEDFFPRSAGCPSCRGLAEELRLLRVAARHRFALAVAGQGVACPRARADPDTHPRDRSNKRFDVFLKESAGLLNATGVLPTYLVVEGWPSLFRPETPEPETSSETAAPLIQLSKPETAAPLIQCIVFEQNARNSDVERTPVNRPTIEGWIKEFSKAAPLYLKWKMVDML